MTMQQIVDQLNKWAHEYYVLDNASVADTQYDALYDELVRLESSSGIVLPDSPTRRVGGEILDSFKPHSHLKPLFSLDKVQSLAELRQWVEKLYLSVGTVDLSVELKYDGLTLSATYRDGVLETVSTRGNGTIGENVTAQARTIKSLPLVIDASGVVELQGEAIMPLSQLEKYNRLNGDKQLKNARNAAAGAIRNLDTAETARRNLDAVFYSMSYASDSSLISSQSQLIEMLKNNKFRTDKFFTITSKVDELVELINKIAENRSKLDYLIDGVVIKVNDFSVREQLGYTAKFPKWAVAYKFDAEVIETTLNSVTWQVGRTGKVTPTANLEPVELCGATIRRATLNNYQDILRKKLSIGSQVLIRRSNDVIPEVLGLAYDNENKLIEPCTHCPDCGSELVSYGAHLFCTNSLSCKTQQIERIVHYCSKGAMDIRGVSDSTIKALVDNCLLSSVADLYDLTTDDLLGLDKYQDTRANNVINSINASKNCQLDKFIYALGIDNVGAVTARDLVKRFGSLNAIISATADQLIAIDGIGDIVADSIVQYFSVESNKQIIDSLLASGVNPVVQSAVEGVLTGMNVVLTGSLDKLTRGEAGKLVEKHGGTVASSVSKTVNLVVAGEKAGSKLEKANKLGIKVISEQEFLQLIGLDH